LGNSRYDKCGAENQRGRESFFFIPFLGDSKISIRKRRTTQTKTATHDRPIKVDGRSQTNRANFHTNISPEKSSNNGSPFIVKQTRQLYAAHAVMNLLSPPLTPQYNRSIEVSAGQLKTRAALLAQLSSCDTWTCDILEAAVRAR